MSCSLSIIREHWTRRLLTITIFKMSVSSMSLERFPILHESMGQLYQDILSYAWMQYRCIMTMDECDKMFSEGKWNSVDEYIQHTRRVGLSPRPTPLDPRYLGQIYTNANVDSSDASELKRQSLPRRLDRKICHVLKMSLLKVSPQRLIKFCRQKFSTKLSKS